MPGIGEKEVICMKRQIDSNMPIGKLKIIDDFLPSPDELTINEKTRKITIAINESSIEFFKKLALKKKIKYQPLIRKLIEKYVEKYSH